MRTGLQGVLFPPAAALALALLASCGGGGGGVAVVPTPALNITTTGTTTAVIGTAFNFTIVVVGGTGAKTFSITGNLPAGLTLNTTTGAITGTPMGPVGTANFSITVMDSGTPPQSDTQALSLQAVDPLVIAAGALPDATVGAAYNQTVVATGGTAPYSFSISAGSLPAGLAISGAGSITGTPTATATNQTFTVRVTDGSATQQAATRSKSIRVTLQLTTSVLPDGTAGIPYDQTMQARGGLPPYQWEVPLGPLPDGLALNAVTGAIFGTPPASCVAATSTFTARVTDSAAAPASASRAGLQITVNPGAALNITTLALPNGVVGIFYNAMVQAAGGVPPYSFAVNGTLPSGLGPINAMSGQLSGTPNTVETRSFDVIATDNCGTMDSQTLSITINAVPLGRNDSIATATPLPLGNASFAASISPSGHPNTVLDPDEDYYRITTQGPLRITIDIDAQANGSPLDSVIEFVDANGVRLNSCNAPTFLGACVHDDDVTGVMLDSILEIQVNGATTFYVHVVDFRGDGRPDLLYDLVMSIAN
ncbi:MAG: Ig domain-containing protein [Steroidobacteraceae bacterium]